MTHSPDIPSGTGAGDYRSRQIDEVAQLFPYISTVERFEWWIRLGCSITELTKYMESTDERLQRLIWERQKGVGSNA